MKPQITEKDNLHLEWYKQAKKTMDEDEIKEFANDILEGYHHDYGTQCHAVASAVLAHLHNYLYEYGMTGMQASFVTWEIINKMFNVKVGAKLIRYDKMLYPQYEYDFNEKTISEYTFKALQEKAKESLSDNDHMHPNVRNHMESIVDGKVPFGYTIEEE